MVEAPKGPEEWGEMTEDLILTPEETKMLVQERLLGLYQDRLNCAVIWTRIEAHAKLAPPPLGKDKVWHGALSQSMPIVIVRARSAAEAIKLLNAIKPNISPARFKNYWNVTKNRKELLVATERGVWFKEKDGELFDGEWVRVK
jgi:hypothetical protein